MILYRTLTIEQLTPMDTVLLPNYAGLISDRLLLVNYCAIASGNVVGPHLMVKHFILALFTKAKKNDVFKPWVCGSLDPKSAMAGGHTLHFATQGCIFGFYGSSVIPKGSILVGWAFHDDSNYSQTRVCGSSTHGASSTKVLGYICIWYRCGLLEHKKEWVQHAATGDRTASSGDRLWMAPPSKHREGD